MKYKEKIKDAENAINCWYKTWNGKVFVSFSGGKDSTVLLHLVRTMYPEVKAVFSNTGLEYPEIVKFVKTFDNVDIIRPKKNFKQVVDEYGWPVVSKYVSRCVATCRNITPNNHNTVLLYLTGYNQKGEFHQASKLPNKWFKLLRAPFKVSDICCKHLKKEPMLKYKRETGLHPMIGMMMTDSSLRRHALSKNKCNNYDSKNPTSNPLKMWDEKDIWKYIRKKNLKYCSIYDKGEKRTGCVFCMFGIMFDRDRFKRLKKLSPKQYDFVINKMGGKEVLNFLEIEY